MVAVADGVDKATRLRAGILATEGLRRFRSDPLDTFRFMSEGQRVFVRWAGTGVETLALSSNSSGKTTPGAAFGIALARGLRTLDGEPLPEMPIPNIGWVLTQSYKQQLDSAQAAYKRFLGDWPHYIAFVVGRGKGYWESVYIATAKCSHGTGQICSECPTCSRISFHCEESKSSIGGRIDWAHADEPPAESVWREIRSRRDGDKKFLKFITATPLERERWVFMQDDFPPETIAYESPYLNGIGNCEDPETFRPGVAKFYKPKGRRAVVRWTLYDNEALSDETVAAFISDWKGDPFIKARIRGDYVDTAGKCPFPVDILQEKWLPRCRPGTKKRWIVQDEINVEHGDEGYARELREVSAETEEWWDPEPHERYVCVLDPSAGIAPLPNEPKSQHHDPAGILVVSRVNPRVVARYNGYLSPYGLGSLAAQVATRYNDALVDVDTTGGYGAPCYSALHAAKYRKLMADITPDKPGQQRVGLGYKISSASRGRYIGDVQQAIIEDSILCLSREVISCLLGVTTDATGKITSARARKGRFDEDMSCLGRALALLQVVSRKPRRVESMADRIKRAVGLPHGSSLRPVLERW